MKIRETKAKQEKDAIEMTIERAKKAPRTRAVEKRIVKDAPVFGRESWKDKPDCSKTWGKPLKS